MSRFFRYAFAFILVVIALGVVVTLAVEPYEVPAKPQIQRPQMTTDAFVMSDGGRLPFLFWSSASSEPRAVVIALHGGGHYSAGMAPLGESLRKHGITTYAYDLRGHGRAPDYGKWIGGEVLTRDLAEVVSLIRQRHSESPIFVAGLSFGATVIINALAATDDFAELQGAILMSPGIKRPQLVYRAMSGMLGVAARLLPEASMSVGFEELSDGGDDYLAHERSDPLNMKTMELNFAYGGIQLMELTDDSAASLDLQVLMLFGYNDAIMNQDAYVAFGKRIRGPTRIVGYPNGHHVLTWDKQREVVFADIASWTLDQQGPIPSTLEEPPWSIEHGLASTLVVERSRSVSF